jgi:hypothetical protein
MSGCIVDFTERGGIKLAIADEQLMAAQVEPSGSGTGECLEISILKFRRIVHSRDDSLGGFDGVVLMVALHLRQSLQHRYITIWYWHNARLWWYGE